MHVPVLLDKHTTGPPNISTEKSGFDPGIAMFGVMPKFTAMSHLMYGMMIYWFKVNLGILI